MQFSRLLWQRWLCCATLATAGVLATKGGGEACGANDGGDGAARRGPRLPLPSGRNGASQRGLHRMRRRRSAAARRLCPTCASWRSEQTWASGRPPGDILVVTYNPLSPSPRRSTSTLKMSKDNKTMSTSSLASTAEAKHTIQRLQFLVTLMACTAFSRHSW